MLKVGLTGGIGSGKSTVAKIFEVLHVPVYYADDAAKRLMNENAALKSNIEKTFGTKTYINNELDRKFLASVVFDDPEKLQLLNALVHPVTIRDAAEWMLRQETGYILKEAALIFESGSQQGLDYVIGVSAPEHLRIKRVMERDNISREQVLARMERQISEKVKMELCDFVLINDEHEMLLPQVIALHEKLIAIGKSHKEL